MASTAIIAGVGPGFCEELVRKLANEGHPVVMFGRSAEYLRNVEDSCGADGLEVRAVPTDVTDPDAVASGVERAREEFGKIEILAHTASTTTGGTDDPIDPARFEHMWRLYALGGLLCFREVLADLRETGGTVLFFGASPMSGDISFKSGKDATRGLARGLADTYGADGVHVAHVIIDGGLLNPDVYEGSESVDEKAYIDPIAAADACYHLIQQPDRARTFELDLHATDRPASL